MLSLVSAKCAHLPFHCLAGLYAKSSFLWKGQLSPYSGEVAVGVGLCSLRAPIRIPLSTLVPSVSSALISTRQELCQGRERVLCTRDCGVLGVSRDLPRFSGS